MYSTYRKLPYFLLNFSFGSFYKQIKSIGHTPDMDDYEKRKLSVFNQINALGIIAGLTVSVSGLFDDQTLPIIATMGLFPLC